MVRGYFLSRLSAGTQILPPATPVGTGTQARMPRGRLSAGPASWELPLLSHSC